jgi:hypothetical protein
LKTWRRLCYAVFQTGLTTEQVAAMANESTEWREETARVDGANLIVVKGGSGRPLLVLHEELGHPGWLKWHAALARRRTLLIPHHPGYGRTERVDWILNIRDLAGFYGRYLKDNRLAPVDVIGFSLGGWIAAGEQSRPLAPITSELRRSLDARLKRYYAC